MWDVGGQKSLRSYWRNYFECTDGLVWVVDSADKRRLQDCMNELHSLLLEEVLVIYKTNCIVLQILFTEISRGDFIDICQQTRFARSFWY